MLISGYSDQGGRDYNEDTGAFLQDEDYGFAVLADGLGGHGGGRLASEAAVKCICSNYKKNRKSKRGSVSLEQMQDWTFEANQEVLKLQTSKTKMKTTLVQVFVDGKKKRAVWLHLGDSRLYYFKNRKMEFYTFDHSVSRMAVLAGEITLDEIRHHADRSKLLKVLGVEDMPAPEGGGCDLELGGHHAFLLCSDGFWEYISEREMEECLEVSDSPKEWISKMRNFFPGRIKPGNDNNSAIAIFV